MIYEHKTLTVSAEPSAELNALSADGWEHYGSLPVAFGAGGLHAAEATLFLRRPVQEPAAEPKVAKRTFKR